MTNLSSESIAAAVEKAAPGLVRVDGGHRWNASGTVWSEDGVIVTANHVLERDEDIEITLHDGATHTGSVVGRDEGTDLAIVRLDAKGLSAVTFRALEGLKVGHLVVAVARPGKTVRATLGIVSTFGESYRTPGGGHVERYLEADADMPPGYSGGLLLDLDGNALGMNNRGVLRHARVTLPHVTLERVVGELLAHGKVRRGYLGVGVHPVKLPAATEQAAGQPVGILIHALEPGSPAEKAGMLIGDVILELDGVRVGSPWELASALRTKVEVKVVLKVVRAGKVETVEVHT